MSHETTHPNIILITCDELRPFELGCHGHPCCRTLAIDALAAAGCRFETAISNNPVCMPGRSIMLSGQYSRTCMGYLTNVDYKTGNQRVTWIMPQYPTEGRPHLPDPTLPELLRAAGYTTAAIGKWHIESWPDDVGFDHYIIPRAQHANRAQLYCEDGGEEFCPDGWTPDYDLERCGRYLRDRAADRAPFFLYYNISMPHMPLMEAPERYRTMYGRDQVVVRDNVDEADPCEQWPDRASTYLWDYRYYRDHLPYTRRLPRPDFCYRDLLALYQGLVTWSDDCVAALLAHLHAASLTDDTIVVFTADHGDNLGSHRLMGKCSLNDESLRIPYIVSGPGINPQINTAQVASLLDLAPTLLSLAGCAIPSHLQGVDLAPVLYGEGEATERPWAIAETVGQGAGVRTPTHTFGRAWGSGWGDLADRSCWYSDNRNDPFQLAHNLPLDDTGRALSQLLDTWIGETPWMAMP